MGVEPQLIPKEEFESLWRDSCRVEGEAQRRYVLSGKDWELKGDVEEGFWAFTSPWHRRQSASYAKYSLRNLINRYPKTDSSSEQRGQAGQQPEGERRETPGGEGGGGGQTTPDFAMVDRVSSVVQQKINPALQKMVNHKWDSYSPESLARQAEQKIKKADWGTAMTKIVAPQPAGMPQVRGRPVFVGR